MYVQEIILQGFKTYMNRTVISGFDPQFNAITGLNGSGKSNILDAIQFLLGSTSKEMLRLKTGLTQLIYKEGFAGIQKASVTIKFRCKQRHMRPTGYEGCEELIVTRQITKDKITKFFVNGQNSNLSKVKNLFRSVQLNIENPHFLVKQGQITKIINLKPLQLLGMIEQTAGTAYYNKTRSESQKIIERKQQKLTSINEILQATIRPQMDKLQIDRKKYAAFRDKEVLSERLNNKIKRHQYAIKIMQTRNQQYKYTGLKETLQKRLNEIAQLQQKLIQIQNQIKILRTKGDTEFLKDYNHMKTLILEQENKRKTIKNRLNVIQQQSLQLRQQTAKNQQQLDRLKQEVQWYEKQSLQAQKQIGQLQDLLNDLGKSTSEQQAIKLIEKQLKQEMGVVSSLKQEIRLMESKKQTIKKQSENQLKSVEQAKQNMQKMIENVKQLDKEIQGLKMIQKPIPVEDPQIGSQELKRLENQRKKIINENHRLAFHFNDPSPGFNRNLVKGKLFMIFRVKDKIHEKALQIGIGPRIINIVVENEVACQALVKAQSFGPTATLIPNNKIRYNAIKPEVLRVADDVARQYNGLAKAAYELIDYPQQLRNSIMFAFGNFIICSSSEIAKKIAYNSNRSLQCKCVTYDGDVYEPGTLTGGSDVNQQFLLPRYRDLRQIEERIGVLKIDYDKKNKAFQEYNFKIREYNMMEKEMQTKITRKEKLNQKLSMLSVNAKPRDYSDEISGIQKRIQTLTKQLNEHESKVKQLSGKTKTGSLRSLQEQKKHLLSDKRKCEQKLSEAKKKININQVQMQQIASNMKISDQTQIDYEKQILELEKNQNQLVDDIKQNKIQFAVYQQKKLQYEKEMTLNMNQVQLLASEGDELKKKKDQFQQSTKTIKQDIYYLQNDIQSNEQILATILRDNAWLEGEKLIEIQPDFNYDHALKQYHQLLVDADKLRKTVKVNVDDHSYQKLNEQYKNLLEKKAILENDKKTLLNNMHELDDKRTKTLETCFKVVKENLGTIFNDLLPGATAHLTLVDDYDVTKGAELRVHFNNVKKELSELSGGQRSLLALSFILALLLYKPSPFYILDEIDSALDLSHTENIGYMISKRFPQSQFLLISLKQGMFQNANVLYKVHFAQGESKVDRQVLKKKK